MFGLAHVSIAPFILGMLMAIGVLVLIRRFAKGEYGSLSFSLCIWYLLYKIHGNSTEGGMAVMIAALILDLVALPLLRYWRR